MNTKNETRAYVKPIVLAASKNNSNFSSGCPSKGGGVTCVACRCR